MKIDIQERQDVKKLVDQFYERATADDLLGPIFSRFRDPHADKETLYNYWEQALLHPLPARHQMFPKHIEMMFSRQHFIRWLTLFLQTIDDLYAGANAEKAKVIVIQKSEQFQTSLQLFRF